MPTVRIMIMAGGTGGHVYPALAVARVLRDRGHEVVWMGTPDSFESRVVPAQGYPIEYIRIGGLRGKGLLRVLLAPLLIARAMLDAWAVFRRRDPAAVLGMGGYAAGPGGLVAWLWGLPLLIHESNAVAGMTNRLLARVANCTMQAFPGTFRRGTTVGNPVRREIVGVADPTQRFAGRNGPLRLLVLGGSQGARFLNQTVPQALATMADSERPQVRHQAGRTLEFARTQYAKSGVEASIEDFIEDMAEAYAWADLVICRAGASTIAELAAAGCASILVPFPSAVDDHQTHNALHLVRAGAARLLPEGEMTPSGLAAELRGLGDRGRLLAMAAKARSGMWRDAEQKMADLLEQQAQSGVVRDRSGS